MLTEGASVADQRQHSRQQRHLAHVVHENAKGAVGGAGIESQLPFDGVSDFGQRLPYGRGQCFGAGRGRHAVVGAHEQRILEQFPQSIELLAHRGLSQMQIGSGRSDAACLKNGIEDAQQVQIEIVEAHGSIDLTHMCDGLAAAPGRHLTPGPPWPECIGTISTFHSTPGKRESNVPASNERQYLFTFYRRPLRRQRVRAAIRKAFSRGRQFDRHGRGGSPARGRRRGARRVRGHDRPVAPADVGATHGHVACGGAGDRPSLRRLSRCRGQRHGKAAFRGVSCGHSPGRGELPDFCGRRQKRADGIL